MSDITELEQRIVAALERISTGVDALGAHEHDAPQATEADPAELTRLQTALDDEKTANAQLEERVKAIHEKLEGKLAETEAEVAQLREQAQTLEADNAKLRSNNDKLRQVNEELRDANAEGVSDATLINSALAADLEALHALRNSERVEVEQIIAELTPLVEEGTNA